MEGIIRELRRNPLISEALSHYEAFSGQEASLEELPERLEPALRQALAGAGIRKLYSHQAEAIERVFAGENIALITPTASGKTLAYNIPVFERLMREPGARALYLFPLKALAQDQLSGAQELLRLLPPSSPRPEVAVYDGDTSPYRRERLRLRAPQLLISNPDMLHHGILPYHEKWASFLEGLKFVVMDELHTYRGVFGNHIAQVLRRLLRVASLYGASPQMITCSATLANATELARELTGLPFSLIDRSGAPRPRRHFLLLNPSLSPHTLASRLFSLCLSKRLKTIAFTKARRTTELIFRWTLSSNPSLLGRVSSYRAGFLPEERREIERELREGRLLGVVSTSALEMGIDIGGLDVAILIGYPGSIINTWQRGGRAGRGERESLTVLIAGRDALDQYFARHPEDFLGRGYERAVIDPKNPQILKEHLPCAASEEPLRDDDPFFPHSELRETFTELEREGGLLRSAEGPTWHSATILEFPTILSSHRYFSFGLLSRSPYGAVFIGFTKGQYISYYSNREID
ncbi:MAG: DEAD/DEAH box helicase [Nitrospinota bacterium]